MQDKADILDLPQVNINSSISLDLLLNIIDSGKIPDCLQEEDSTLPEDDLSFLPKYIALLYLNQILLRRS